jgi:hypothetical protein
VHQRLRIFSVVFLLAATQILGCAPSGRTMRSRIREAKDFTLTIEQTCVSPDSFSVSYSVRNASDESVWVCEGVSGLQKPSVAVRGTTLVLKLLSSLPYDPDAFYPSILAGYYKLDSGESAHRTMILDLPISTGPLVSDPHPPNPLHYRGARTMQARSVVLQVGCIHQAAFDRLADYAKRLSTERAVVAVIRPMKIDEPVVEAKITDVRLDVKR